MVQYVRSAYCAIAHTECEKENERYGYVADEYRHAK